MGPQTEKGFFLGLDIGSVSTNIVLLDPNGDLVEKQYLRTNGQPIEALKQGLGDLGRKYAVDQIAGVGATGSGRQLASAIAGADIVKNEITAHAFATSTLIPGARTVIEIGGQDSKLILLKDGMVVDFAMNTVCAAGTGSFLDRQAARLDIPIEQFGAYALRARNPVRIAGRCAVFAETDMIHKQQTGCAPEDIIAGVCEALVRNYLSNLAKGKTLGEPVVFQGGVAANIGIVAAFEKALSKKITVPVYYDVMGAYGAALTAKQAMAEKSNTSFRGFDAIAVDHRAKSMECSDCSNLCEIVELSCGQDILARWGGRCGKWAFNQ